MGQTRILLGDDHSLILDGVRRLLESHYHVVGAADNGKDLVETALRLAPDLVILDVSMPVLNGIDAAREIKRRSPPPGWCFSACTPIRFTCERRWRSALPVTS